MNDEFSTKNRSLKTNTQDLTPKTLLVTGGAGFIGSNFIRYALDKHSDWKVVNLDKLTYAGNLLNLQDMEDNPRYQFLKGDICNRQLVDKLFGENKFDIVVNFAAESHVDRSILDASPFIETNIKGTQTLMDVARTHWSGDSGLTTDDSRLFVQISTDEVYGSLGETGKFTEDSPLRPNSPYAASKASADMLCRSYYKSYDLPVIITRSSNNYGPYQFPEKLIPLMIRNALNGKKLPVYGEGKQVRDWIYVKDNCRAIDLVLQKGQIGEVYNIGGNCEKQNLQVVKQICNILEAKLRELLNSSTPDSRFTTVDSRLKQRLSTADYRLSDLISFIEDPRGSAHDFRYALDCSKIRKDLDWIPKRNFKEGLEQTIRWYLENQKWAESVITGEYQEYYQTVYGIS